MDREDKKKKRRLWKAVIQKDINWLQRNKAWVRMHPAACRNRKGWTIVHQAVESQSAVRPGTHKMLRRCVEFMDEAGFRWLDPINMRTTSGLTPAHVAIYNSDAATLQVLLELGADFPNLQVDRSRARELERAHERDTDRIHQLEAEQARSRSRARDREDSGLLERALGALDPTSSTPAELATLGDRLADAARRVERETIRREVAAEARPPPPPAEETCSICLDRAPNMTFVPCGHRVTCDECAARVTECPSCRARIRLRQRTYG